MVRETGVTRGHSDDVGKAEWGRREGDRRGGAALSETGALRAAMMVRLVARGAVLDVSRHAVRSGNVRAVPRAGVSHPWAGGNDDEP